MKLYKGHDPTLGDEGTDLLLTVWDDGVTQLATRPGCDRVWVTWGPPVNVKEIPA